MAFKKKLVRNILFSFAIGLIFVLSWLFGVRLVLTSYDNWFEKPLGAIGDISSVEINGGRVVDLILEFHSEHGVFPSSLSDLEQELPLPMWGTNEWSYKRVDDYFELEVKWEKDNYYRASYALGYQRWFLDT